MDKRLDDVLHGREGNYLLPFYWQRGTRHEKIPEQIARIRESGCGALCVEGRPHPDFGKEGWWRDVDLIVSECARLGMKVWILDDKHFPTGFANGCIASKHPHLRAWRLREFHVDVMGPIYDATLLMEPDSEKEPLVGVFAYRRAGDGQKMAGPAIDLTGRVRGGTVSFDIPEGCWRVFFLYKTRRGGLDNYIDLISKESAAVQIEAVYEPHYARYAKYFGNVIAGFFSDEPQFRNGILGASLDDPGGYFYGIGKEGLALPYNERLLGLMSDALGADALPRLPELWYESPGAPATRFAYMDVLTRLYRECFSQPVGDWCRAHGVEYIGHVIEDMNAHGRMGYGPGHYFRAIGPQDMGGIDIVLHQVLPGFAHHWHTAICLGGSVSSDFNHYVLGKLAPSIAHLTPHMRGRAMCEVFGAFGWAEGAPMMKWLLDFLLVRGVNHFVPHAFSPEYPDDDCPPHFGAEGHDPQFEGFSAVMRYANKAAHLLTGGRHVATAALLYHAEGEWMSGIGAALTMDGPARELYDAHLDFDIVPCDTLLDAAASTIADGRLRIAGETFGALVVPYAPHLPPALLSRLGEFRAAGLPVLFAGGVPEGIDGEATPLESLASAVRGATADDVSVDGDFPELRVFHVVRDDGDVFMFFNESASVRAKTTVRLGASGPCARLRLAEDFAFAGDAPGGALELDLLPGQSEIVVFGGTAGLAAPPRRETARVLAPIYEIETASSDDLDDFRPLAKTDRLFNVASPEGIPDFAGRVRYRFALEMADGIPPGGAALDLGKVGETARLWVNGRFAGIRVAEPYRFEVGPLLHAGANDILVETANTLALKLRDRFSFYLAIRPCGMLGPVTLHS